MKRALAFIAVVFLATFSFSQTGTWRTSDHLTFGTRGDSGIKRIAPGVVGVTTGGDAATDIGALQLKYLITSSYTVATLPASPTIGSIFTVTDVSGTCASGGGTTKALCRWNGASYDLYGGGGGGSGTVSGQANGVIPLATASTTIGAQSHLDDGVTTAATITSTEPLAIAGDGVHAAAIGLLGNTTAPSLTANSFHWLGPNSASFTAWGVQMASAENASAGILHLGAASSHVSQGTVSAVVAADTDSSIAHTGVDVSTSYQVTATHIASATQNVLMKAGATGNMVNSSVTDDGTTVTSTDTGGFVGPSFTSNGATAGFADFPQGTTSASVPPCNVATSICEQAPTSVTSYLLNKPGAAANGIMRWANAANVVTASVSELSGDATTSGSNAVTVSKVNGVGIQRVTMVADWTCGTAGTSSSCTAATIVGTGGTPLTITLPSVAASYHWQCDGVVGQATAATANSWNVITATNAPTNLEATYSMNTAATAMAGGALTGTSSTSTSVIGAAWTLGGTATKMPFHIQGSIEGASASGTVVSLQLVAPTVADLVTVYRGATCSVTPF